jgi:hypothetical protein
VVLLLLLLLKRCAENRVLKKERKKTKGGQVWLRRSSAYSKDAIGQVLPHSGWLVYRVEVPG